MTRRDCLLLGLLPPAAAGGTHHPPGGSRARKKGWIVVRLSGSPEEIGFQHGRILAREIEAAHRAVTLGLTHDSRPYSFFRQAAEQIFWPATPSGIQSEIRAMADALREAGSRLDLMDLVVHNAALELPYYVNALDARSRRRMPIAERCSAFVATGSYTSGGGVVAAHNCWSDYLSGAHCNIIFDVQPSRGERFLMDGIPGLVHSGDDFSVTSGGLIITETTISNFHGFDEKGVPEYARARLAMQYSRSIDDFVRIMREGNNGGYANHWLVADYRSGEIGSLELGLRNAIVRRTRDGYFSGSNDPVDPKLAAEETDFDLRDTTSGPLARRARWRQLIEEHKGRIDLAAAQRFLADHYDVVDQRVQPGERTLCGHVEESPRGVKGWAPPYGASGSVQNKAIDSRLASRLSFTASFGHACGTPFRAADHLKQHRSLAWQSPQLLDIKPRPWTLFAASAGSAAALGPQ